MKRWLIWFGIGVGLFALVIALGVTEPVRATGFPRLVSNILGCWTIVTVFAIPIGIIVWLVRGRGPKPLAD